MVLSIDVEMRLLHTTKLTFAEFFDSQVPEYCILSHRWAEDEVAHDAMRDWSIDKNGQGYRKIYGACRLASRRAMH